MEPVIIPRSKHNISRKNIDPDALKVLYRLYRSGFTAYLVGGGVRDLLLGRRPKDFDIGTSARPPQVRKLFRNCWLIGKRFRLAHIHFQGNKVVEVSTFRSEPARDENEPDSELLVKQDNTFGTPEEDSLRRDFTINGLFYDIASFSLIDFVGGMEDIESRTIRTIGDPNIRFREDPVRMIRALKFAARLDFDIEPETWDALIRHRFDILKSPPSRVQEEIARLLEGGAAERSFELLAESGFLRILLPTVSAYLHPDEDVWRDAVSAVTDRIRVRREAALAAEAARAEAAFDEGGDGDVEESDDEEPRSNGPGRAAVGPSVEMLLPTDDGVFEWRRRDLLWDMLGAADRLYPRQRPALFASLVHPLLEACRDIVSDQDIERMSQDLMHSDNFGSLITRKDRERIAQILLSHKRLLKKKRKVPVGGLLRKPYFGDALQFLEIEAEATGENLDQARRWRERLDLLHAQERAQRAMDLDEEDQDERQDSREYRVYAAQVDTDSADGYAFFEDPPESSRERGPAPARPRESTAGSPPLARGGEVPISSKGRGRGAGYPMDRPSVSDRVDAEPEPDGQDSWNDTRQGVEAEPTASTPGAPVRRARRRIRSYRPGRRPPWAHHP